VNRALPQTAPRDPRIRFDEMKKGVCYGIFSGFTYDIVDLAQVSV